MDTLKTSKNPEDLQLAINKLNKEDLPDDGVMTKAYERLEYLKLAKGKTYFIQSSLQLMSTNTSNHNARPIIQFIILKRKDADPCFVVVLYILFLLYCVLVLIFKLQIV